MSYHVDKPEDGWKTDHFTADEKRKLRPIAETLAMLDGNAFFGLEPNCWPEHYEQYLPEAHALYESNGGDKGWAGRASFAKAVSHQNPGAMRAEGEPAPSPEQKGSEQ